MLRKNPNELLGQPDGNSQSIVNQYFCKMKLKCIIRKIIILLDVIAISLAIKCLDIDYLVPCLIIS